MTALLTGGTSPNRASQSEFDRYGRRASQLGGGRATDVAPRQVTRRAKLPRKRLVQYSG